MNAILTSATLAFMSLLAVQAAADPACAALTQNLLTSVGCPSRCGTSPCVLFSPSQNVTCQDFFTSGPCRTSDAFVVPGTTAECTVTYQCLDSIVDTAKKWFLALTESSLSSTSVTTAAVTEIKQLQYSSNLSTVQLAGGLGRNVRGDVKNVILDESFFATPSSTKAFYLSELNLPPYLSKIDFASVKWAAIAWNNANLQEVPAGLSSLSLQYVELSKNFIRNINDSKPFAEVSTLKLQENDLTDFNIELPGVVTLNLSGNPLTKIPDSVFRMTNLVTLSMRNCNLMNVQLTEEQFTFLAQRQTVEATFVTTNCGPGHVSKNLTSGNGAVCIPGNLPDENRTTSVSSSSTVIIVVISVVAGVLLVSNVASVLWYRRRLRQNSDDNIYVSEEKSSITAHETDFFPSTSNPASIWDDPELLIVRLDHRDIDAFKLLARGSFGEVWLGLYMNQNVAVKRLVNDKKSFSDVLTFVSEIKVMARLEHPKIVRFIGVSWTNALTIQIVTEFMDCGDLRSLLDSSRASSLTWANLKCQIAVDVASALVYLHTLNPELIHRDLKSRNVLMDAKTGAKLSDFGISRHRSVEQTMTAGVGTARWIAPEVILGGHYTEFADIYSFGVLLSELDTSMIPFHDVVNEDGAMMQDMTILQLVSAGGLQPSFTSTCPASIVTLARACLAFDPEQRPSSTHVAYELRQVLKDLRA